jgi:hypothetical protein
VAHIDESSRPRAGRRRSGEYILYFVVIFLLALPFAAVDWVRDVAARGTLNLAGPLARAWAEAERVVPLIFSA